MLWMWVFLYMSWKAYIIIAIHWAFPQINIKSFMYSIHECSTPIVFRNPTGYHLSNLYIYIYIYQNYECVEFVSLGFMCTT